MSAKHFQILILGGGTGGVMTAAQMRKKDKSLTIGLVEPSDKHFYQPAWTLVGGGTFKYQNTIREEKRYIPKGVEWIKDYATKIDADNNIVGTKKSGDITYDYLVVSTGLKMDLDALPGLKETLGKNNVCSNYIDPEYTWKVLQSVKGGNAVFTQASGAIKCGGAPQKIMYLAEDYFRKHGTRDKFNIIYAFPGGVIFGVEPFKSRLYEIVDERNISLKHKYSLAKIDGPNKKVYFTKPENETVAELTRNDPNNTLGEKDAGNGLLEMDFEMLHLAPPQSPQDFVQKSKLAFQDGPNKGYIDVDQFTLKSNRYDNVYALGDNAALPTAKTGAAIRKQVPVLVDYLSAQISGAQPKNLKYEGYSSCPIVTGYGRMLLAEFGYGNERMSDPFLTKFFDTSKESWPMWILKKFGLPFLYWNMMLRGRM